MIHGGGSITRISNYCGPQNPTESEGFAYPAARDQVISRERVARWYSCG